MTSHGARARRARRWKRRLRTRHAWMVLSPHSPAQQPEQLGLGGRRRGPRLVRDRARARPRASRTLTLILALALALALSLPLAWARSWRSSFIISRREIDAAAA